MAIFHSTKPHIQARKQNSSSSSSMDQRQRSLPHTRSTNSPSRAALSLLELEASRPRCMTPMMTRRAMTTVQNYRNHNRCSSMHMVEGSNVRRADIECDESVRLTSNRRSKWKVDSHRTASLAVDLEKRRRDSCSSHMSILLQIKTRISNRFNWRSSTHLHCRHEWPNPMSFEESRITRNEFTFSRGVFLYLFTVSSVFVALEETVEILRRSLRFRWSSTAQTCHNREENHTQTSDDHCQAHRPEKQQLTLFLLIIGEKISTWMHRWTVAKIDLKFDGTILLGEIIDQCEGEQRRITRWLNDETNFTTAADIPIRRRITLIQIDSRCDGMIMSQIDDERKTSQRIDIDHRSLSRERQQSRKRSRESRVWLHVNRQ